MKTYALQIGKELFKVRGIVNSQGSLEWKSKDGSNGVVPQSRSGKFCLWSDRRKWFPECTDAKE